MDAALDQVAFGRVGNRASSPGAWSSFAGKQPGPATDGRVVDHSQGFRRVLKSRSGGLTSREEELSLFDRWKTGGGDRPLHALVLAYEPLVTRIVQDLRRSGLSVEDSKQEAPCGLLEAARCFAPSRAFRFGTYARWWIFSAASTYLIANKDILSSRRMKRKPKLLPSNFVSLAAPKGPDGESAAELIPSDEEDPDLISENAILPKMQSNPRSGWNAEGPFTQLRRAGCLREMASSRCPGAERIWA